MQYIKIFLASSIVRFHNERLEIADCIRALNDRYIEKDIYFKLFICEDESEMLSLTRKQDDYNKEIESSDFFYLFVADSLGQYSEEEFNIALNSYRSKESPQIYTYFFQTDTGCEFCNDFVNRLNQELGHYYSVFSNIDSVKLHILMELINDPRACDKARVEFKDGIASVDDTPVVSLEKIPAFCNNKSLQDSIERLKKLNEEFAILAVEYGKDPQNINLLGQLSDNAKKRSDLETEIHSLEKTLFDLMKMTCEKKTIGSWRTQKALEEIEKGNYEGALNILRDAQRITELKNAEEKIELAETIRQSAKNEISNYVEENVLRIRTLELSMTDVDRVSEIVELYEQNTDLFLKHNVREESVTDYLQYLLVHNQNNKVISVAERIEKTDLSDKPLLAAAVLNIKGSALSAMNRLSEALKAISDALSIVNGEHEGRDHSRLKSDVYYNYGYVLFAVNDFEKARECFLFVYEMLESGGNADRETIERTAQISISLGCLYSDINKRTEAEQYYRRAMDLISQFREPSVSEIRNKVVLYNNLGVLYIQKNEPGKAMELLESAMNKVEDGEKKDPAAFLLYRSMILLNQGMIMFRNGDFEPAQKKLEESLKIRGLLLENESETILPLMAVICHDLGCVTNRENNDGNVYFDKAEKIETDLSVEQSEVFRAYIAITRITKAALDPDSSSDEFEKCVQMSNELIDKLSVAYKSYLGMSLYNAGIYYYRCGNREKAVYYLNSALNTYDEGADYTGEENKALSYRDIQSDIKKALSIISENAQEDIPGMWGMDIYEIWNGQITGMPVRVRV